MIGVDPRTAGHRPRSRARHRGLNRWHARGITTGSLFVAADNEGALELYYSLGFAVHRIDRAYQRDV